MNFKPDKRLDSSLLERLEHVNNNTLRIIQYFDIPATPMVVPVAEKSSDVKPIGDRSRDRSRDESGEESRNRSRDGNKD